MAKAVRLGVEVDERRFPFALGWDEDATGLK